MESPIACVEEDEARNNIYINAGSIRPTALLTAEGLPETEAANGNILELSVEGVRIKITVISTETGQCIMSR